MCVQENKMRAWTANCLFAPAGALKVILTLVGWQSRFDKQVKLWGASRKKESTKNLKVDVRSSRSGNEENGDSVCECLTTSAIQLEFRQTWASFSLSSCGEVYMYALCLSPLFVFLQGQTLTRTTAANQDASDHASTAQHHQLWHERNRHTGDKFVRSFSR